MGTDGGAASWSQQQVLGPGPSGSFFGSSVSMSGFVIAVGAFSYGMPTVVSELRCSRNT